MYHLTALVTCRALLFYFASSVRVASVETRCCPMKPVPPVTSTLVMNVAAARPDDPRHKMKNREAAALELERG